MDNTRIISTLLECPPCTISACFALLFSLLSSLSRILIMNARCRLFAAKKSFTARCNPLPARPPFFFSLFLLPFSSLLLYILDRWLAKADTLQAATLGFLTFLFAFSLIPLIFFFLIGERLFFLALFSPTHVDT